MIKKEVIRWSDRAWLCSIIMLWDKAFLIPETRQNLGQFTGCMADMTKQYNARHSTTTTRVPSKGIKFSTSR